MPRKRDADERGIRDAECGILSRERKPRTAEPENWNPSILRLHYSLVGGLGPGIGSGQERLQCGAIAFHDEAIGGRNGAEGIGVGAQD